MSERIILLLDMDAFFAAIEERESPHFKGRPLVVGADPKGGKGRGVVSTANYEARKYGIHSALPISKAWQLCPQAVFLPVNGALYGEVSRHIMEILQRYTPLVEQVSLDEAYLDMSFAKTYEKAEQLAQKMRKEILKQEQLPASCGIGPNKMVAKIACQKAKPRPTSPGRSPGGRANGILVVEPKDVESFLEPLSIEDIPGIGPKTATVLQKFFHKQGLTVQDMKEASKEELMELLGVFGETLYERVRGIDDNPVVVEGEIKSIGKEHTFETDTRDGGQIFGTFRSLVKDVWQEAKEQGISFKGITVRCRFQGFETHTKAKTGKEAVRSLEAFQKEAGKLLLRFLVENPKPVRLVGVRASLLTA